MLFSYLIFQIFERWKVQETLRCSDDIIVRWFNTMEAHYHNVNPYHNATHAADVLQVLLHFAKILIFFQSNVSTGHLKK